MYPLPPLDGTRSDNIDDRRQSVHSDDSAESDSLSSSSEDSLFETLDWTSSSDASLVVSAPIARSSSSPKLVTVTSPVDTGYLPPLRIRQHLFKSTEAPAISEMPLAGSFSDFLATPGTVWVDKLPFVCSLCALMPEKKKLALIRRPSGLGHATFGTTAMFAYEYNTLGLLRDLFPTTTCFPSPQPAAVVLALDMGWAFEHSFKRNMESRINHYMNRQLDLLLYQIGNSFNLPRDRAAYLDADSRNTFRNIIHLLRGGMKLVVLIKNINWPLIHSTRDSVFHAAFLIDIYVIRLIEEALELDCIAGGVLLGLPVEDEPAWVHSEYKGDSLFTAIACDITHDERVRGAFGFSLPEITSLADELVEDLDARLSFLDDVKASRPAYRHGEYIEYSMKDVLSRLREITGQPDFEIFDMGLYLCRHDGNGQTSDDIEMDEVEQHLLTGSNLSA